MLVSYLLTFLNSSAELLPPAVEMVLPVVEPHLLVSMLVLVVAEQVHLWSLDSLVISEHYWLEACSTLPIIFKYPRHLAHVTHFCSIEISPKQLCPPV